MNPLLPLLAGLVIIGTLAFWALMQNWLADIIHQARQQLGLLADPVETALVLLDRAIVNSQRVVVATGRAIFRVHDEPVTVQEVREMDPQTLPVDVLRRLEGLPEGQILTYQLSVGKEPSRVTHRVEVKRAD
ncbi:MAG TPA: hypothetical protein VMT34_09540 [Aggregatilineales bacterium]|nr:hypothetical protein [Aggregatilineales bacterium]